MNIVGSARKVTIYISDRDRYKNSSLQTAILRLLKDEGAAGATVTRGLAGFGAHSRIHTVNIVSLTDELPLIIEWVDQPNRVERILPKISAMVVEGLITVQDVDVVRYSHRAAKQFSVKTLVKQVMSYEVAGIVAPASVSQVVALLIDKGYRVLPVVDDQWHVLGVISEGDLLRAGVSFVELGDNRQSLAADKQRVADLMTTPAITVPEDAPVTLAIDLMVSHGVKRLPVLDKAGTLSGLLSRVDILRLLSETDVSRSMPSLQLGEPLFVEEIMLSDVPTVLEEACLSEIVDLMLGIRSRRVVVVDAHRRVVGIITDGDLLARVTVPHRKSLFDALIGKQARVNFDSDLTAAVVMTKPAITVAAKTSLADALTLLVNHGIKRLPVVDEAGQLIGLVGRGGILRALHQQMNNPDNSVNPATTD